MSKDLEVVKKIEQSIGRELEQSEKIDFDGVNNSYVLDYLGDVIGLGLYNSRFNELELLLESFSNLLPLAIEWFHYTQCKEK